MSYGYWIYLAGYILTLGFAMGAAEINKKEYNFLSYAIACLLWPVLLVAVITAVWGRRKKAKR